MKELQNRTVDNILSSLSEYSINDKLEILANIFVELGLQFMNTKGYIPQTPTLYKFALDDVQKNGDTLGNTILRQGLVILKWIKTNYKEK